MPEFHVAALATSLTDWLGALAAAGVAGYALALLVHALGRRRAEFDAGVSAGIAFAVRIAAAVVVSLLGAAGSLRGTDEESFLANATKLADAPVFSRSALDALTSDLHLWVFSVQLRMELPEFALRITQIGLATAGLILVAAAVYDLAGAQAARRTNWVLAFEPTSVFFGGLLHKEALMLFAVGLFAVGSVRIWNAHPPGIVAAGAGCAVAIATRPYAGWFLTAALVTLILHAGLRRSDERRLGRLALCATALAAVVVAAPRLAPLSSQENLERLQATQDANFRASGNLTLDPVDYSSRAGVVMNVPRRARDVLLRPYPWQLDNLSQQLGFIGTLAALLAFSVLLTELFRNAGRIAKHAAPLLYPAGFLLVAYSLSAGNAGTSFRYRTQLIALGIAALCALWATRTSERPLASVPQR